VHRATDACGRLHRTMVHRRWLLVAARFGTTGRVPMRPATLARDERRQRRRLEHKPGNRPGPHAPANSSHLRDPA
jgi:hypothetical protein